MSQNKKEIPQASYTCPECGEVLAAEDDDLDESPEKCPKCGQSLNWADADEQHEIKIQLKGSTLPKGTKLVASTEPDGDGCASIAICLEFPTGEILDLTMVRDIADDKFEMLTWDDADNEDYNHKHTLTESSIMRMMNEGGWNCVEKKN